MPHCSVEAGNPRCSRDGAARGYEDKKDEGKVAKAVLSTTAKARAKAARRDAEKRAAGEDVAMETEEAEKKEAPETGDEEKKPEDETKPPEPSKEELENPARVTPGAGALRARFDEGSRFVPAVAGMAGRRGGFVVLKDTTPGEEVEYVASTRTIVPGVTGRRGPPPPPRRARGARRAGGRLSLTPTTCEGDERRLFFSHSRATFICRGFGSGELRERGET